MADQYSVIILPLQMTDAAEPAWAESILGNIWDQLLSHGQTSCASSGHRSHSVAADLDGDKSCHLRLTQLELFPPPTCRGVAASLFSSWQVLGQTQS